MKDRSLLLLLLVLTVVYVFYLKPQREKSDLLKTKLSVLDSEIAMQNAVKSDHQVIEQSLKKSSAPAAANDSRLYPAGESNSLAMVDFQEFIKKSALTSKLQIITSTWGEQSSDAVTGQTRYPLSMTVKGAPSDIDTFLRTILYGRLHLKIDRASLTKTQDQQLLLNFSLMAFKRDGKS